MFGILAAATMAAQQTCPCGEAVEEAVGDGCLLEINYKVGQEQKMWCWAAVTEIAVEYIHRDNKEFPEYYGLPEIVDNERLQCQVVDVKQKYPKNKDNNCDSRPNKDMGGYPKEVLKDFRVSFCTNNTESLTAEKIKSQTEDCSPIPFIWKYGRLDSGEIEHALIAGGYITKKEGGKVATTKTAAETTWVFVVDPNREGIWGVTDPNNRIKPDENFAERSFIMYNYLNRDPQDKNDDPHHILIEYNYNLKPSGDTTEEPQEGS